MRLATAGLQGLRGSLARMTRQLFVENCVRDYRAMPALDIFGILERYTGRSERGERVLKNRQEKKGVGISDPYFALPVSL